MSQCVSCGTLCEEFPILDLASLQLYSTLRCTVVVGDLYIQSLAASGCDRLCPARYTAVGTVGDDSGCTDPSMNYFLITVGTATVDDLALLSRIMARVVFNVTSTGVCTI